MLHVTGDAVILVARRQIYLSRSQLQDSGRPLPLFAERRFTRIVAQMKGVGL
jgi:hypothetical protein